MIARPSLLLFLACALVATVLALPVNAQVPQDDDAGSGRDAGSTHATGVPIDLGVHRGTLSPHNELSGDLDRYLFQARAGTTYVATSRAPSTAVYCSAIFDEQGRELADDDCDGARTVVFTPERDGVYGFQIGYFLSGVVDYTFELTTRRPWFEDLWPAPTESGTPTDPQPTVVVAVADSGVNPYHEVYHRPEMTTHPCLWVEGFDDCSIPALDLSIGEYDSWEEAYQADRAVWASIEPGQWYWIPRTNIIGAVCSGGSEDLVFEPTTPLGTRECILDEDGHGTGTTSSVLSEAPDALLLVHEGGGDASGMAYAPVVPDIQSHSWGPTVPLPVHMANTVFRSRLVGQPGRFFADPLFFLAAGNSTPSPSMVNWTTSDPDVHVVGGAFPGEWTTASYSTFDFASWFCRPTATPFSTGDVRAHYCGTSFSTPTVAGTAAAALLKIRRADAYTGRMTSTHASSSVTREAFVDGLRLGATYDAEAKFPNVGLDPLPLPPTQQHLLWGHGWLDSTRVDAVVACARSAATCQPPSTEAQMWFSARDEARRRQNQPLVPYDTLTGDDDDAGSGRDAAERGPGVIDVEVGIAYDGGLQVGHSPDGDLDGYRFTATAGRHRLLLSLGDGGGRACATITLPGSSFRETFGCDGLAADVELPEHGRYLLTISSARGMVSAQDYTFELQTSSG